MTTGRPRPPIGAHVSVAGGLVRGVDRALELGAETVQFFLSPPQTWRFNPPKPEDCAAFVQRRAEAGIGPVYLHAIYLVNLAGPDQTILARSIESLVQYLRVGAVIGAEGVIVHLGSARGRPLAEAKAQVAAAIGRVLSEAPAGPALILEQSAGMGESVGHRFEDLADILEASGAPDRVKVCLDTAHLFAAGYPVADPEGLGRTLDEFDRLIGLSRLVVVHANDSKVPFNSGVDRHENIGDGHIGLEGFRVILGEPRLRDLPFILEVPGVDNKGPDRENVERLKRLRAEVAARPGSAA